MTFFFKKKKHKPDQFLDQLNSYHPNIEFTFEENPDHFPDTAIHVFELRFTFSVYSKPGKIRINWNSAVPISRKRHTITGVLHRSKRIATDFKSAAENIKNRFLNSGYPKKFIEKFSKEYPKNFIEKFPKMSA